MDACYRHLTTTTTNKQQANGIGARALTYGNPGKKLVEAGWSVEKKV